MSEANVSDSAARRAAHRAGYVARKSRWRRDTPDNHGEFMLIERSTNVPVAGFRYDLTAAEVNKAGTGGRGFEFAATDVDV